jgi:hypothetical protein
MELDVADVRTAIFDTHAIELKEVEEPELERCAGAA